MADVAIEFKDSRLTTYDTKDLKHLRKSAGGMGFLYFNPHSSRYEQVRRIEPISDELKQRILTRSAAVATKKSRREVPEKLPTHIRLHKITVSNVVVVV